ncbi:MAG TPA: SHOCT domain-containing protein [Pedococcus sp.]|nr:SHOCT domain-containing protein [Pedococcus sp.]
MPGLLRGVARTAVIAGTASAVSGRVQRRQAAKFADRDAETAATRERAYEQASGQEAQPAAPAAPQAASSGDMLEQLKTLGELKAQGVLTEEEFAQQKARILAG